MTRSTALRAGLLLAVTAMPLAAVAAPPPVAPTPNHPVTAASPAPTTAAGQPLPQEMEQKLDAHIQSLHQQLSITQAEEPEWNQFASVMHDNAVAMHAAIENRGGGMGNMNAAENMQSYAGLARVHADNMQKLAASFQTLYSSFSDEQKQVADKVFRHEEARHESKMKHTG